LCCFSFTGLLSEPPNTWTQKKKKKEKKKKKKEKEKTLILGLGSINPKKWPALYKKLSLSPFPIQSSSLSQGSSKTSEDYRPVRA
tara:strand:+ start:803 stop:1057 length:255 start_codon:yes stop_codon:yes gene_type:complete